MMLIADRRFSLSRWFMCLLALTCLFWAYSCHRKIENPIPNIPNAEIDLDSIYRRGSIILLTENSSSTYFQYRNTERGYDFEAVRAFAQAHHLKLEVKVVQDLDEMFGMLMRGEGDIIASNITITPNRLERMEFTKPVYTTRQMLVQHKPTMLGADTVLAIRDSTMLEDQTICVHRYSAFQEQLNAMSERLDLDLKMENSSGEIGTGEMIRLVNNRSIGLTVTDENLIQMDLPLHDSIDASVPISEPQAIAWAVRKNAPQLLAALNTWMDHEFTKLLLNNLHGKYFQVDVSPVAINHAFELPPIPGDSICPYDTLFRRLAPSIGWDWRMLAALGYQESGFNSKVTSWSGAMGVMQLMPETGTTFGCDSLFDARCNILAAVECIRYLQNSWSARIRNAKERDKFVLASYNIGQGHIFDAQLIARKIGLSDTIWDGNVAEALLLKQEEKYFRLPEVKHGYCNAKEPYQFVARVQAICNQYKRSSQLK